MGGIVTLPLLNMVDTADIMNIKRLFHYITATAPGTKLPRPCLDKAAYAATLIRRAQTCGQRIQLVSKCVQADGRADWRKSGVYCLHFDPATRRCTEILHRPGDTKATLSDYIWVGPTFELSAVESDFDCRVRKGVAEYKLCECFERDGIPWSLSIDRTGSTLQMLPEVEATNVAQIQADLDSSMVLGREEALQASSTKCRQEAAAKARAKRAPTNGAKRRRTLFRLTFVESAPAPVPIVAAAGSA